MNDPLADIRDLLEPVKSAPTKGESKLTRPKAPVSSAPKRKIQPTQPTQPTQVTQQNENQSSPYNGLNPMFANKVKQLQEVLRSKGIETEIASGYRDTKQQQKLYNNRANNPYPVARPGTSKHEKRIAVDLIPVGQRTPEIENIIGEEGERLGLKWGGRFKRYDPVHFQLDNVTDSLDDIADLLEDVPKGKGVVEVKEIDDSNEPIEQTKPLEFNRYEGDDLSIFSKTAAGAAQWANNQLEPKKDNANLLGKPFNLSIKSDGSRLPSGDEVNQAMLNSLGASAKIANDRYKQETGNDLIQVNIAPDELQKAYNKDTKTYELKTFPSQEAIRIVNAYLEKGVTGARDEAVKISKERKDYNAELDKAANTPRGWTDTFKAGAADAVGATQQLAYNAATIPEAVAKGEYYGYDSPQYKELEKEDKTNQQVFDNARASLPKEESTGKSIARGLESGLIQLPFYANPAAPVVAFTANANRGVIPATGEGMKMVVAGGGGRLAGGLTDEASGFVRQVAGRGTQGAINAGGELLSGNTNINQLAESFIQGAAMPLGKRGKKNTSEPSFGRVPRSIYDPTVSRAPESSFTLSKQIEALQNNSRKAVLITEGENKPAIPKGYETLQTSVGTFIFNPAKIPAKLIQKMVEKNTFHRLLGIVEGESKNTDRVVIARDKETGEEIQAAYVSRKNQREQIESFKKQYPDAVIETGYVKDLESKVINERFKNTQDEIGNENLNQRLQREEGDSLADINDLLETNTTQNTQTTAPRKQTRTTILMNRIMDVWNIPRAVRSSFDLSAAGRQGLVLSVTHPIYAIKSGFKQFKSLFKEENYEKFKRDLRTNPDFTVAENSGLYFGSSYDESGAKYREENYQSDLARKIPGVKQSERAFVTYIDNLRMEVFTKYKQSLESQGITPDSNPKAYKDIARFINIATGRGQGKIVDSIAPVANMALFSPRNLAARFQLFNPVEYVKMDKNARKLAMVDMGKYVATLSTTLVLAKLAGADVSVNPEDSDFGKIRVGDTVYDLTAGHANMIRFLIQSSMSAKRTAKGEKHPKGKEPTSLGVRFFRSQLNPSAGYVIDTTTGKNFIGEKVTVPRETLRLVTPMFFEDLAKGYFDEGMKGIVRSTPAAVGVGVNRYKKKRR